MKLQTVMDYPFLFIIIPFVIMLLIYVIMKFLPIHQWRKIHLTAEWSALFYVAGVIVLVNVLYNIFILSYVLIAFILFLAIHITIQWKKDIPISLKKAIVLLSRLVFLLFLLTYIVLVILFTIQFFA